MISQEWLKIEVKLLLGMVRQTIDWHNDRRMALSGLKWRFPASRAVSSVAELLVNFCNLTNQKLSSYCVCNRGYIG